MKKNIKKLKQNCGYNHETLKDSGLKLFVRLSKNEVILEDQDGNLERWVKHPHYAGYAIIIGRTSYEYVGSL
jgi:hypothetical protein